MGGLTTPFLAAFDPDGSKTDKLMGKGQGGGGPGTGTGGGCGPPYTESYDHEFEPGSGTSAGGVNQAAYCARCGVTQSMHGQGASGGGAAGTGQGGPQDPDDDGQEGGPQGGGGRPGTGR